MEKKLKIYTLFTYIVPIIIIYKKKKILTIKCTQCQGLNKKERI